MNVQETNNLKQLDHLTRLIFKDALRHNWRNPGVLLFLVKTIITQRLASLRRQRNKQQGLNIPPFMIFSITNRCNLSCHGCYRIAQGRDKGDALSDSQVNSILTQAQEIGISITLISGGEPLSRENILDTLSQHPDMIFAVFTNGLMINNTIIKKFKKHRNIMPVISVEGLEVQTDKRRGKGVHKNLNNAFEQLKLCKIMFGISFTLTSTNFNAVIDENMIQPFIRQGCRFFFFVEYVPVSPETEALVLSPLQKQQLNEQVKHLRAKYQALFFPFPGGEEDFGGCLAAGRGFIHINADGAVEPCPFAPFSDNNLTTVSLKNALTSPLLKTIRENHHTLQTSKGGCTLWENRHWLEKIAQSK